MNRLEKSVVLISMIVIIVGSYYFYHFLNRVIENGEARQAIINEYCDDLIGATCISERCWKELNQAKEMCGKVNY